MVPYTYRYDPVADAIDDASIPDLPGLGVAETRAVNWNGQLWVVAGLNGARQSHRTVYIWQPGSANWTPGPPITTARADQALDAQPGVAIYMVGGYAPFLPTASMEVYNAAGGSCYTR